MKTRSVLNNKAVANITAVLTKYKANEAAGAIVAAKTPLLNCYQQYRDETGEADTALLREQFLRCARYLKWNVAKRGGVVYDNGIAIWRSTVGH